MDKLRTIVEGAKFSTQAQDIADVQRMDEILDGIKWVLARTPECGVATRQPGVYAIGTWEWTPIPLLILYSFDSERVVLEAIVKSGAKPD